jgi:hypothetical protein
MMRLVAFMDEKIEKLKTKTEQAKLMGIKTPKDGDWSNYSSKICGSVGGASGDSHAKDTISSSEYELNKQD